MSTLRISNIEAKSVPASATVDEKVKITNSSGDTLVFIDGKTSGITTVGINTTDSNITFDANSNIVVTGIITATRFSGEITPTSLEIGSNIKLGNAGVITATSFVGSGANLTNLPAQVNITNNANNRVITGGSGVNLNGEGDLTFDGNQLYIDCNNYSEPLLINSTQSSVRPTIRQTNDANANSGLTIQKRHSSLHPANYWYGDIQFQGWDGSGYHRAGLIECVAEGTPANDNMPGNLRFSTNSGAASQTERFRITAGGQLRLMEGNNVKMSVYNDGSQNFITSNTGQEIKISCGNGDSNGIEFWDYTGNNKRCQIDGDGIKLNTDTAAANALDDYEEGSFTPFIRTVNNTTEPSYSHRVGLYTKVGRLVTYAIRITTSGELSTGSGATQIHGLPFNAMNWNIGDWPGGAEIAYYSNLRGNYGTNPRLLGPYNNNTYIRFHLHNAQTDTGNNLYNHIFTNNTVMIIYGQYFAA